MYKWHKRCCEEKNYDCELTKNLAFLKDAALDVVKSKIKKRNQTNELKQKTVPLNWNENETKS